MPLDTELAKVGLPLARLPLSENKYNWCCLFVCYFYVVVVVFVVVVVVFSGDLTSSQLPAIFTIRTSMW